MPIDPALDGLPANLVTQAVLGGGDVYGLCFTAAPGSHDRIFCMPLHRVGVPVTLVGHSTQEHGMAVVDAEGRAMSGLPRGLIIFRCLDMQILLLTPLNRCAIVCE